MPFRHLSREESKIVVFHQEIQSRATLRSWLSAKDPLSRRLQLDEEKKRKKRWMRKGKKMLVCVLGQQKELQGTLMAGRRNKQTENFSIYTHI